MNNRLLLAALAGGLTAFLAGWILYGPIFGAFFKANVGTASGAMRADNEVILWSVGLGSLAWGLFYALVYSKWAGITTFMGGAKGGAWMGLLLGISYDFISYGTSNIMNMTGTLVDPIVGAIMGALIGGVVGWALGYKRSG